MPRNCIEISLFAISVITIACIITLSMFLTSKRPPVINDQRLKTPPDVLLSALVNSPLLSTQNKSNIEEIASKEPPQKRRRSLLIFGQDRSGTTFLSAMFARDPQIFMVYEPLWITRRLRGMADPSIDFSRVELDVASSILGCRFSKSPASTKFLSYVSVPWTGALPNNVFRSQHFCNKTEGEGLDCPDLSQNPQRVDNVCRTRYKHSVTKVAPVRLPHEKLADLVPQVLTENPDVDIRVLHVIRDPRGNINSRIDIQWMHDYPNPLLAKGARELCNDIVTNLNHAKRSLGHLKHRYKLILYKQIADNPIATMHDIYEFAGFEKSSLVETWIEESTNPKAAQLEKALKNPYSPVRNATGNADKWKADEFFERNRVIEEECKTLMNELGFEKVPDIKISQR